MKLETRRVLSKTVAIVTLFCMVTESTFATLLNLSNQPLFIGSSIPPKVMLTISKDQQLFKKAYNDYSDLDTPQDGKLETTYKKSIKYYGYFDSTKCYDYTADVFVPAAGSTDAEYYCVGANASKWSGNFLNWVSMTRMDTVRKLLYGGHRVTDDGSSTVLERAFLPQDAHSYAKYYAGQIDQDTGAVVDNDIHKLTPFSGIAHVPPQTTGTSSVTPPAGVPVASAQSVNTGLRTFITPIAGYKLGHQVRITATDGTAAGQVMFGHIAPNGGTATDSIAGGGIGASTITVRIDSFTGTAGTTATNWRIDNMTMTGLSFCNATLGGTVAPYGTTAGTAVLSGAGTGVAPAAGAANSRSQTNTNPPLMRVASGNYALWASNERYQCNYAEDATGENEQTTIGGRRRNGNRVGLSGLNSSWREPSRVAAPAGNGLGNNNYIVRVQACVTGKLGEERCKQYPDGIYKPIGLLQEYGDVDLIYFGLMTGSYAKNISGGVLRKNVGPFSTGASAEVDKAGNGRFLTPANGSIVRALNAIRIIGYDYRFGHYLAAYPDGDNCNFQLTNIVEGQCRSWASPVSEIYFEALRYFAGKTAPTAAFAADDTASASGGPGLTNLVTAPWPNSTTAVLDNNTYCSPLNILVFNASVSTNEDESPSQITPLSDINVAAATTLPLLTKSVGDNETGADRVSNVAYGTPPAVNQFFFGKSAGDTSASPGFELCSAKTPSANGLGDVIGICPEGPTVGGTYHIAGLAYHAKTTRIRPGTGADAITVPASDVKSLKVTTYGISLATNVPTLPIKVLGDTNPRAIIQPIYRLLNVGVGGGALVDLKIVSQTVTTTASKGSVYLNWEDSEQGGDYDQDLYGILQWCLKLAGDTTVCPATQPVNTLTVTTQVIAESTGQGQGFGYVVSGTTKDGPHFHSGIENFNFCDTSNIYNNLQVGNVVTRPVGTTLTLSAVSGAAVTVTASAPVFTTGNTCPVSPAVSSPPCNDVGRYVDGSGRGVITAVASSTVATLNIPAASAFAGMAIAANAWALSPHTFNDAESCAIPLSSPATTLTPPANVHGGGCKNCNVLDPASTAVYALSGTAVARNLKDPLWYAAKYGGFTDVDSSKDNIPNVTEEWDKRTATGAQGSDGIPDNYFLVTNPLGLVAALDRAFIAILSNASASSVATNSTSLQTGTTIYQARFNANDWSGQVLAFPVNTGTGQIEVDPLWDAGQIINSQHPSSTVAPGGTASSMATADIGAAGRTIFTYNEVSKQGVALRWPESTAPATNPTCANPVAGSYGPNTISPGLVTALNTDKYGNVDTRGCRRLEWLRGDPQHEGATAASFRVRPVSRLGDIVNSDPNFVAQPNAGFGDSAYATFRQAHINRPAMIYVGGNDGMLHAFRASDGRELLGYVPSKVFRKLSHLMDRSYTAALQHRYFVDASPEISDAFITKSGVDAWRTVLVSGMGHGAQGLFALDITDPTLFSETTTPTTGPNKVVLWEFNDSDDPNLGFIMGQPVIRKMANGKWAAIVSGGYNNARGGTTEQPEVNCTVSSTLLPRDPADLNCTRNTNNGRAYLYIIFLNGPDPATKVWRHGIDYIRISTTSGLGNDNGLAQPLAADVNGDGVVDYVYAGDLFGNLHKFNVKNTDPLRWRDITNREILFTARDAGGNAQPITAKPEATLHPTGQGFIIAFGTGKYLETTDPCPPGGCPTFPTLPVYQRQSFYGIWDKDDHATTSLQTVVTARNQLLQQTIENVTEGTNTFRVVSNFQPDWFTDPSTQSSPTKDLGWFMDFPQGTTTGERSVFRPILTSGRLIFTTLLPLTNACEFGGTSFLMVVDPTTGGRIEAAVLNVDNVSDLNAEDKVTDSTNTEQFASGVQSSIGITPTPTIIRSQGSSGNQQTTGSQILGTSGPLLAGAGFLLAYALAAGSSGGNASTMIGLSASGGRVSWRELLN